MFQKAVKIEAKLRLAIAGPSGSGKTYTALAIATALVPGGKIAVIDTEHGSAAKYADLFTFDVAAAAPPYHPNGLIQLVAFAADHGYDVVVVDSVSHYWSGAGGILDLKEEAERRMRNPNSYTAWKDVTPIHQRMVDTLVAVNAHVIVTMRSKQEYILVEKNGKQVPQKVGMAPVQRDGFEYEFDVMLDMDIENVGRVMKTRCPALTGGAFVKPGADMAGILREWLTGEAPEKAPAPVVFQPQGNGKQEPPKPTPPPAPLPDDELVIYEADGRNFVNAAASLLQSDTEAVKERLHALGYDKIPGDKAKRLDAYRKLRDGKTAAPAPVAEAPEQTLFPVSNGAYEEN